MELTPEQVLLLGVIAPLIVQFIKLLGAWLKGDISPFWITVILFVVSVVMAYFFVKPKLPTTGDPMELANFIVIQIGAVMGIAMLVYKFLYSKVFDALKLNKERFLAKG